MHWKLGLMYALPALHWAALEGSAKDSSLLSCFVPQGCYNTLAPTRPLLKSSPPLG